MREKNTREHQYEEFEFSAAYEETAETVNSSNGLVSKVKLCAGDTIEFWDSFSDSDGALRRVTIRTIHEPNSINAQNSMPFDLGTTVLSCLVDFKTDVTLVRGNDTAEPATPVKDYCLVPGSVNGIDGEDVLVQGTFNEDPVEWIFGRRS